MGKDTYPVEVRAVETEYGETGVGQQNRTETTYELGATVNGAWVKFAGVPSSTVDSLVARAKENAPPPDEGPTMADVTPTPAPQEQAGESQQGTTTI